MTASDPTSRASRTRARLGSLLVLWSAAILLASGCSEKRKALGEIRASYAQKNYEETTLLCQRALRKNINDGEVYYYYGLSLIELGRDYEGFARFQDGVAVDSTMGPRVASHLLAKGRESLDRGDAKRASTRLRFAADLDAELALGTLKYLVAEAYFGEREFERAAAMYSKALAERPDTAAAEAAYFNLAECYVALGDSARALATLDRLVKRFPAGSQASEAQWKLVNLLYEHAASEFSRGNYEVVVEEIRTLLTRTTNVSLLQRARFLLGEAYERLEDYPSAYEQYKTIIDQDRGASGRIVERARQKINALRDSGLL
jgi:tetratricopeptide (TPR) repeat protein